MPLAHQAAPTAPYTAASADVDPDAIRVLERVAGVMLVRELIALHRSYVPVRRAEARAAWEGGDLDGVRRACRALRSGSAQLGLHRMAYWCGECERHAAAGDHAALRALLDAMDAASDAALEWLEARAWRSAA